MSHTYDDVYLVAGSRTGFADYTGTLSQISPTDLGIAVGREALKRASLAANGVHMVSVANVGQSSFDAFYVARHIALYSGVPLEVPAVQVGRLCCSGFEAILNGADAMQLGRAANALCVGTESMSRFPVASYETRGGFGLGQVDFRDFLWECLRDTAPDVSMGGTAENLAKQYSVSREDVDAFAELSFARAMAARERDFHAGEIVPLVSTTWEVEGLKPRGIKLPRKVKQFDSDEHVKPTSLEQLAALRPAFGGVQTGGNSSAIVDGAAAVVLMTRAQAEAAGLEPLARVVGGISVGVQPATMGIGPAPAIRAALERTGLSIGDIDRFEINEAFGAQYIAVERELGLDRDKVNVNGGAIAIGHPLGATGVRCTLTLARELSSSGKRYGIASACAGGGQGTAIVLENMLH